jgi:hypothetical protein
MILRLLFAPVTGPFTGITWIAEKILEQVEDSTDELEALQKQLLTLQLAFDMGDIPEDESEGAGQFPAPSDSGLTGSGSDNGDGPNLR